MNKIILGIVILLIISCKEKKESEFSLKGKTKIFRNGTSIYLSFQNKIIDSTKIENNAFLFTTKLPSYPLDIVIHTKEISQTKSVWIENKPMVFDATETDFFKYAKIIGSKTEDLRQKLREETKTLSIEESSKKDIEFVKNNPDNIISAELLSFYSTTWGKEKTKELFAGFSEKNKVSVYGKQITKYIELNREPKIGEKFVDFEMKDQNGNLQKISDIKGKTVLLEFWASYCGFCLQENPNLVKTYKDYKSKGFEIFAVSLDADKNDWIEAIKKDSLNWTNVNDLKGNQNEASFIYGINSIPNNFLIAENGKIIAKNLRGDELNNKLKEILK